MISAPDAANAAFISSLLRYLPVPTISRLVKRISGDDERLVFALRAWIQRLSLSELRAIRSAPTL